MGKLVVSNVGKAYKRYPSKWARAREWLGGTTRHEKNWVLKDISFSIAPGEAVGIIGVNGVGKSTLLKIMTGTTQPTTGSVRTEGRLAALLELGMGFHPDFTGRQNVYMAGQLLGLKIDEITACMPAIEAFAEIGSYMDRPVRTYSSGMQMRVAFSIATAVRPDVLIVDEALSVGDAYFQHKSFDRIREFGKQGTTLLIVSHDRAAIQLLCTRAILLDKAGIARDGRPQEVMDFYNALIAKKENSTVSVNRLEGGMAQITSGTGAATIESVQLCDENRKVVQLVNVGQQVSLAVRLAVHVELPDVVVGYVIRDRLGQEVFGTNTHHLGVEIRNVESGSEVKLRFAFSANMGVGSYSVSVALHGSDTHLSANYQWRDLALVFEVVNLNRQQFVGVSWIPPEVECER